MPYLSGLQGTVYLLSIAYNHFFRIFAAEFIHFLNEAGFISSIY